MSDDERQYQHIPPSGQQQQQQQQRGVQSPLGQGQNSLMNVHRRIREELESAAERLQASLSPSAGLGSTPTSSPASSVTPPLQHQPMSLAMAASPTSPQSPTTAAAPPTTFAVDMSFLGTRSPLQPVPHRLIQRHLPSSSTSTVDVESGLLHQLHNPNLAPHHPQIPAAGSTAAGAAAAAAAAAISGDNNNGVGGGGGGGGAGEEGESITGMFRQMMGQNPELRGTVAALEKYIPFVIMLAFKLLFDHGTGIIVSVCLITTFFHANSVVKQQVGRQDRRNFWALLAVLVNLVACVVFIYFVFQDEKLYNCAIFLPPTKVESLYELIWLVGVNDFILKFIAVIFKIVLIFFPGKVIPYQKRGKYFLFIERASQLHRELAPIQVWLVYLLNGYEKIPGKVLGVILVAAYMVNKGKFLLRSAKAMKLAVEKMMQSTNYGKSPSADQLKSTGNSCPICYDSFRAPTMLHCKHIFCEDCLTTWFDRERTCPLCRAQVTEDPQWRDGSTSQFVQLF